VLLVRIGGGGADALGAAPAEDDLGAADREALTGARRDRRPDALDLEIAHTGAVITDQVVVGAVGVGVDAGRARTEVDELDLTERGEIVQGLVHGPERDRRHVGDHLRVDGLGSRVRRVAVQGAEDALTLRRDLATGGPEEGVELVRGPHGRDPNTNDC
jgi:hypothetical protein